MQVSCLALLVVYILQLESSMDNKSINIYKPPLVNHRSQPQLPCFKEMCEHKQLKPNSLRVLQMTLVNFLPVEMQMKLMPGQSSYAISLSGFTEVN